MDQRPVLDDYNRRQVRRTVLRLIERGDSPKEIVAWIHDSYSGWGHFQAYALAYYGAVYTAEPLELARVRDSRS